MPLFCTLKATYTGTNIPPIEKFSNNGYPLLFEPVNKHLFYANPDDNTVNKFYCAPLSKVRESVIKMGEVIDVSVGGSFNVQESTSVNDHAITDKCKKVTISKETSVTSTGSLSANQSLTWGSTVNIPISIKTGGTNGHELSLNTGTLTMPANPNTDNHKATHDFIIRTVVDPYVGKLYNINLSNTGSIGDGSEKTSSFTIIPGNNITLSNTPNSITISATNTHTVTHGASIDATTPNSPILQLTKNGSSGNSTTNLWTLQGAGVTTISAYRNNIVISSTDTNTHTVSHGINCVENYGSNQVTVQLTNNGANGNESPNLLTVVGSGATEVGAPHPDYLVIDTKSYHGATHSASIDTTTTNSPILQLTHNGFYGNTTASLWTLKGSGATTVSASSNTVTISSTDTNTHTAAHGAKITDVAHNNTILGLTLTDNGPEGDEDTTLWLLRGTGATTVASSGNLITISSTDTHKVTHGGSIDAGVDGTTATLQLTKNGSSGTSTTNLWTLTGLGATTVSSDIDNMFVYISSTDQKVKTISSTSTVYLSGKTVNTSSIGNEYVNSSVYMNNGSLYSKHFYATTPNTSSWGTSVAAALDIKGNDSGSQTPIFRVTSNTYGNCQLEYCEKWGIMRLYRNGKYTEFPNWNIDGKIPMSTTHDTNAVNTLVHDIRVVSALPSNAASYPNTLFLVTG